MESLIIKGAYILTLLLRFLKLGHGSTLPGRTLLKIYPHFLNKYLPLLSNKSVYITGTNGKTTISRLVSTSLEQAGFPVISNYFGANLPSGVASCLLPSLIKPKLVKSVLVLEIDEGAFPFLLGCFVPDVVCFLNLSRDQLDRYGEIDITIGKWVQALNRAPREVRVIYSNNKQDGVFPLKNLVTNKLVDFIPVSAVSEIWENNQIFASNILKSLELLTVKTQKNLASVTPAFGRGEIINFQETEFKLILAKNPASFTKNLISLEKISQDKASYTVALILNDNIPDGRDVSWIYDIEKEPLLKLCDGANKVVVSGKRCLDLALLCKIYEIPKEKVVIISDISKALDTVASYKRKALVFTTYSAMLFSRKHLKGSKMP